MTQKFLINTDEGLVELQYNDVKTKKLTGYCGIVPNKGLLYTAYVLLTLGIVLVVYDFFKDIGRQVSSVKDLFNGKEGAGLAKWFGFTKGNIGRLIGKFVLFILGSIFFSLSTSMGERNCLNTKDWLERIDLLIKYDDKGIPIEIIKPTDKAAFWAKRKQPE